MKFSIREEFLLPPERKGSRGPIPVSVFSRFMSHVVKSDEGCWIWVGSKVPAGYGKLWIGSRVEKNKTCWFAHRLMWRMVFGNIPDCLCVCHECDNPSCVNPEHLFLGTTQDNVDDRISKGRSRYHEGRNKLVEGQCHGNAKLSNQQALAIYLDNRSPLSVIADDYSVSVATVSLIKLGKSRSRSIADDISAGGML